MLRNLEYLEKYKQKSFVIIALLIGFNVLLPFISASTTTVRGYIYQDEGTIPVSNSEKGSVHITTDLQTGEGITTETNEDGFYSMSGITWFSSPTITVTYVDPNGVEHISTMTGVPGGITQIDIINAISEGQRLPPSGGPHKPRIVLLANSIDYSLAKEFFGFLENKGIEVIYTDATNFYQYRLEKFVVILGGPDAPEGIGEIVKNGTGVEILTPEEQDEIRVEGNRRMYVKTNKWTSGQRVYVIAGSDRYQTQEAHEENRDKVAADATG